MVVSSGAIVVDTGVTGGAPGTMDAGGTVYTARPTSAMRRPEVAVFEFDNERLRRHHHGHRRVLVHAARGDMEWGIDITVPAGTLAAAGGSGGSGICGDGGRRHGWHGRHRRRGRGAARTTSAARRATGRTAIPAPGTAGTGGQPGASGSSGGDGGLAAGLVFNGLRGRAARGPRCPAARRQCRRAASSMRAARAAM